MVGPVTPHQTDMRGIQNPLSEMCLCKDKTDYGEVADVLRNENSNRHTDACHASACSCISPPRHQVADAGFCEDVGQVVGGVTQLAAEPLHHFADQPGLARFLRPPDPLQKLVVGQHPPCVDRGLVGPSARNLAFCVKDCTDI